MVGRSERSGNQLPADDHISRIAASVGALDDSVKKRNESRHKALVERFGRQSHDVRDVIKSTREVRSGPGAVGLTTDGSSASHNDLRWALPRWAIRSRWPRLEDVRGVASLALDEQR